MAYSLLNFCLDERMGRLSWETRFGGNMMRIFGIPNTAFKLDAKALALSAMFSIALTPAYAQTSNRPSREEIYQACRPQIDRYLAAEKATTPKYTLDFLYKNYVEDSPRQAYLLALLPDRREKAAKYPDHLSAAEVCTIELVTGQH